VLTRCFSSLTGIVRLRSVADSHACGEETLQAWGLAQSSAAGRLQIASKSMRRENMKFRFSTYIAAITFLAALVIPLLLAAQAQQQNKQQPRYKLIDLGTLGGDAAYKSQSAPGYQILNNAGVVSLTADTTIPDPYSPNCANPDCVVIHAARWEDGVLTDLGALPGVNSSGVDAHQCTRMDRWILAVRCHRPGDWLSGGRRRPLEG
jgi:hypothetical protein